MTPYAVILLAAILGDGGSITINGPGMTYHGSLDPASYKLMKHRIGGNTVLHPIEFGLTYKKNNLQLGADYLKDCFGHNAGTIFIGPKVDFWKYFSVGGMFGGYIRETMKGGAIPLVKTFKGVDVMPMAGGTFAVAIPISKHAAVEVNSLINFYDNHANIGLRLGF